MFHSSFAAWLIKHFYPNWSLSVLHKNHFSGEYYRSKKRSCLQDYSLKNLFAHLHIWTNCSKTVKPSSPSKNLKAEVFEWFFGRTSWGRVQDNFGFQPRPQGLLGIFKNGDCSEKIVAAILKNTQKALGTRLQSLILLVVPYNVPTVKERQD